MSLKNLSFLKKTYVEKSIFQFKGNHLTLLLESLSLIKKNYSSYRKRRLYW